MFNGQIIIVCIYGIQYYVLIYIFGKRQSSDSNQTGWF